MALARQICSNFTDPDDTITVFTIDPQLEETMINAVHQSEYGAFLALDPHCAFQEPFCVHQLPDSNL